MGASSSVNPKDSYAAEEAELNFRNNMTQTAVDYCREHLFTESPMTVIEVSEDLKLFKVDESRLDEMVNQSIGRIGAPFLVKFNSKTGNIFVQLFPDRKPVQHSTSPNMNESVDEEPQSPTSPTLSSRPTTPSSSSPSYRRSSSFRRSTSRPMTSPSTPSRSNSSSLVVSSLDKIRVIFGLAYMSKLDVPDPPSTPVMIEQSPHHITIEWNPPWNDGGLIEKYEVEYKRSRLDMGTTDSNVNPSSSAYAAYMARNPNKFGWRKLRTISWYEWSYHPYDDTFEEQEETLKQLLLLQQQQQQQPIESKEEKEGYYQENFPSSPSSPSSSSSSISSPPLPPSRQHQSNDNMILSGNGGKAYNLKADLRDLKPASCFQFRVRAANHFGFSEFGEVSLPLQSSPTPPGQPNPPFAVYTSGDAMWLSWTHPELNGLPLQVFELSWKIPGLNNESNNENDVNERINSGNNNGDGGTVTLEAGASSGGGSSFFLRRLRPRTTYSISLRAKNAVGWSPPSTPASITTNRFAADISVLDRSYSALRHREWWVERYDARARCPFLFNVLTGERQGHAPFALDMSSTSSPSVNDGQINTLGEGSRSNSLNNNNDGISGLVDRDEDDEFMMQQAGTELAFMRKRRTLQRALLLNLRASSSSSPSSPTSPSSSSSMNESKYLWMNTSRTDVLDSMLTRFTSWDPKLLRMKRIKVVYEGEDGIDSGGLGKDFFASVAEALVTKKNDDTTSTDDDDENQNNQKMTSSQQQNDKVVKSLEDDDDDIIVANRNKTKTKKSQRSKDQNILPSVRYFTTTPAGDRVDICPNGTGSPSSWRAIGRFIAKAVIDRQLIPKLQLSNPLLKQLLGREVDIEDLKGVDNALYNSMQWTLNNSIEGVLDDETFTIAQGGGGDGDEGEVIELCEGGKDIKVTDENKERYVALRVSWYFKFRYMEELDALLAGFTDLIPTKLLEPFDVSELERLLVGCSEVDVDEIRAFAVFGGEFTSSSAVVLWFWEYWKAQSPERRGKLLNFVTASSRLPLDGFDPPFCLVNGGGGEELPRSHTCFNQLVLPKYDSYEAMVIKLDMALDHGSDGFFAT